jgi:hopene-associated glycosyltransferase HpnB
MLIFSHWLLWLATLSLAGWLYLALGRGAFWHAASLPEPAGPSRQRLPDVVAVMPARNEAAYVARTLHSLIAQDYPGRVGVILVDDNSEDLTRAIAEATTTRPGRLLEVIGARPLPAGWSGKLWAVSEGLRRGFEWMPDAPYVLLTDADVQHDPGNLRRLVAKAEADRLDLVSLMVRLHCQKPWERLLIPPFVFFFRQLYPFAAVNRQQRAEAAANGGCILVRREALRRIGGIEAIRDRLIDDVALAQRIKHYPTPGAGRIWLGLTGSTRSLRDETRLSDIWEMVARYADTRLGHSRSLLVLAVLAMLDLYLVPPLALIGWPLHGSSTVAALGLAGWLCMTLAYWPIVRLHRLRPYWALTLPLAALFYTAMTIDSALQYRRGTGGRWKGRIAAPPELRTES